MYVEVKNIRTNEAYNGLLFDIRYDRIVNSHLINIILQVIDNSSAIRSYYLTDVTADDYNNYTVKQALKDNAIIGDYRNIIYGYLRRAGKIKEDVDDGTADRFYTFENESIIVYIKISEITIKFKASRGSKPFTYDSHEIIKYGIITDIYYKYQLSDEDLIGSRIENKKDIIIEVLSDGSISKYYAETIIWNRKEENLRMFSRTLYQSGAIYQLTNFIKVFKENLIKDKRCGYIDSKYDRIKILNNLSSKVRFDLIKE